MQREQPEAAGVDLDVQLIDRLVADQHGLDLVEIALGEPCTDRRTRSSARPPISSSRDVSSSSSSWKCRAARSTRYVSYPNRPVT